MCSRSFCSHSSSLGIISEMEVAGGGSGGVELSVHPWRVMERPRSLTEAGVAVGGRDGKISHGSAS